MDATRAGAQSIFAQDWWLDAVAPGAWDRVRVARENVVVGELTFHVRRRLGLTFVEMPPLTRTLSPRLDPPGAKAVSRRLNAITIVDDLVARLPRHDRFEMVLQPGCPSVEGFVHLNHAVTHTYTYATRRGVSHDALLVETHKKTRNVIAKAERDFELDRTHDLDRFFRLHALEFGPANLERHAVVSRAFTAAAARGQAELLVARSEQGRDCAAAAVVKDDSAAYYWLTARDPALGRNGANSYLIWEAIRAAAMAGLQFDLDGYASPEQAMFLMKFGLDPVVRPFVNNSGRIWKMLNAVTTLLRPARIDKHYRV